MPDTARLSFSVPAAPAAAATARAAVTRFARPLAASTRATVGDLIAAVIADAAAEARPYSTDVVDVVVRAQVWAVRIDVRGPSVRVPERVRSAATRSGSNRNGSDGIWFEIDA